MALMSSGDGLSNGKLELATAAPEDVISGKTFYSGDKELKTGLIPDYGYEPQASRIGTYNAGNGDCVYLYLPNADTDTQSLGGKIIRSLRYPINSSLMDAVGTRLVFCAFCSSLISCQQNTGEYNSKFISSVSGWTNGTATIGKSGNYRVRSWSSCSWAGSVTLKSSRGNTFIDDDGTGSGTTTSCDTTVWFDAGNTITWYCQRSTYNNERQASLVIYLYYQS